jgi:hypothetical protein
VRACNAQEPEKIIGTRNYEVQVGMDKTTRGSLEFLFVPMQETSFQEFLIGKAYRKD